MVRRSSWTSHPRQYFARYVHLLKLITLKNQNFFTRASPTNSETMTIHEFIEKNGTPVPCPNGQKCFEIDTKSLHQFAYSGLSSLVVENLTGEKWNTHVRVWYTFTEGVWANTLPEGTDPWKGICLAPGDSIVKGLSKI